MVRVLLMILVLINISLASEIKWLSFKEGLEKAKKERKLIIIDIYAQWCHWCNVMENTTYRNKTVIEKIEEDFIPVRVDAEKEPDINKRYNQGGLPTTVILSPDGNILFGTGRYIPPEDMVKLLNFFSSLSENEIKEYEDKTKLRIKAKLKHFSKKTREKEISSKLIKKTFKVVKIRFDKKLGGFSGAPKFPIKELPYFLMLYTLFDNDEIGSWVVKTLDGYAKLIDKVEGGIFRYSTTAYWTFPHYEKLLKDQADLSVLFFNGYSFTGKSRFLQYANSIVRFTKEKLLDKNRFVFYNSQGADIVDENGTLLMSGEEFFTKSKEDRETIISILGYSPKIEKSVYFSNNALMVKALFFSYAYNNSREDRVIAEKVLENIEKLGWTKKGIRYSPDINKYFLNTQVYTVEAYLTGYQTTGKTVYLEKAERLMGVILDKYYSEKNGIFTDLNDTGISLKHISFIDDIINLNYRVAKNLYKLYLFTGKDLYKEKADSVIKRLPDKPNLSVALAYYLYFKPPVVIHFIGKTYPYRDTFTVFPFWSFSHFININDKNRIKALGYKIPKDKAVFICNTNICFKRLKSEENLKREVFSIFKAYKELR